MSSVETLQEERLALMPVLKDKGVILCESCSKPLGDEYIVVKAWKRDYKYHKDYMACANAEPLRRDWKRQSERTKTHNRTKARLQESDGHTGDTDDSMPVWLGDMESEDNL